MQTEQKELIGGVFCEVLEQLAFMFGEPADKDDLPSAGCQYVQAKMTFAGQRTGSVSLAVPDEMCLELAANILGTEPGQGLDAQQATDALKEVLNVVCGHFLTALAGEEPVVNLSVPSTSQLDTVGWTALRDDPETIPFLVDDSPVLLRLSWEEPGT